MTMLIAMPLVLLGLIAAFGLLFRKLASRSGDVDRAEWLEAFSIENYAPIERLLDHRDIRFLRGQPGYRPEIGRRLLRERKRLFLEYLRQLTGDFDQLLKIGRLMVVHSGHDQMEFARGLRRQQIAFYSAVCAVRLRVALYPLGWNGLNVSKLVTALESMHMQVQQVESQLVSPEPA